ncbi:alpha/beta hydrolase [Ralstonia pickettii]|uniref:Alpha/beta hydrolase n=2 Tax=Burkholderiaceae TaxID=119060 RepID=A0A9Q2BY82_RALPI|nr:alpha/beta hydrolase [Ralstonia pickettii]MBA9845647.1 alpha/beta fold hydrolase [Ralstonia pickettii]MBA9850935.1 alpha/beta fold hydrolase [Ralstonia pickettii]MBA9877821.1 alpha/beta fold hydrolase [Ralstonia pickettii]MBA9882378.1 alpha/beta fold hydrolase [Ralstonia pickettii]MBA9887630.1 alpha/beta fold hydrolase [Ralstonia pickettii]
MALVSVAFAGCTSVAPRSWELPSDVKVLTTNGYAMAYVERGQGAPLVLVHGTLGDYRNWEPVMPMLSSHFRTISVSLRHAYPEPWNGQGNDAAIAQHAADLAAFIRALGIGPVHLLGHSRGGAVVLLTASAHPELVRSVILADPAPFVTLLPDRPEVQAAEEKRTAISQSMLERFQKGDLDGGAALWINAVGGPGAWAAASATSQGIWRSNAWTAKTLVDDDRQPFHCNDAARITAPVLLITGDRSPPIYGYMQEGLRPCLKQVTNAVIANAGHGMFRANPKAFSERVAEFVADH